MILSILLIVAVLLGVSPWILIGLCVTWIPDVILIILWGLRYEL